jgi:hypothetical protein
MDYVTSAVKGALGAIPFAGSLLAEFAGDVLPNQRMDRIVKFAKILESRLATLEHEFVRSQLKDENFSDLFEEGVRQAARSLSNERREYIANLITNSLSQQDIEYNESKHLLRILGELNDIEIIWLRFYLDPGMNSDEEFRGKNSAVLELIRVTTADPPSVVEKESLQKSYKIHLSQLGLLSAHYEINSKTQLPVYDRSGAQKIRNYEITYFGRFFLRQIGLSNPE